jgi:hypothetical protein
MVVTKGFDATKKAGKIYSCKAAQHSLLGANGTSGTNGTNSGGGGGGSGGSGGGAAAGFDAAACRAKPLTDYADGWVNAGASDGVSTVARLVGLTCNDICGRRGQTCDPCAISKLNCQDAYKYVADRVGMPADDQASVLGGVGTGNSFAVLKPAPGCTKAACTGPWPQSVCATATQPNSIVSSVQYGSNGGDYPGITTRMWLGSSSAADFSKFNVINYSIIFLYNWYNPALPYYRDPAQACNQVVASKDLSPPFLFYYGGAFCYCA